MEKLNIEDHRRERLKELIDFYGTQDVVADMLDTSSGYLSQILRGRRPFSEKTARKFEDKIGYPENWFDVDEGGGYMNVAQEVENSKYITIQQYKDVRGAMGKGAALLDQVGEVVDWRVSKLWASNLPTNTGIGNLRIVTGLGPSMKGMFNSGDPLIVDIGIKSLDYDAVYFFRVGDEGFIKLLQKVPGEGVRVLSKNEDFPPWYIRSDMDFEIFGRVLKVWEGKDL